jgi:hypothetical protein
MITYDPRNMEWDFYCSLMAELFSSNEIGTVPEERWRDWVDGINGIGLFGQSATPDQRMYDTLQDWAESLVGIMSIGA